MTRQEFKEICKHWKGIIKENDKEIWLESVNLLTGYYENGEIWKQKKALCKVGIDELGYAFSDESCGDIIGGTWGYPATAGHFDRKFKLYKYEYIAKPFEQLELFIMK